MRAVCTGLLVAATGCGEPLPETGGDAGEQIYAALCEPFVDCNPDEFVSEAECEQVLYDTYCESEGINCAEPLFTGGATRAEWNDCLDDLAALTCQELEVDNWLPRSCRDLPF